MHIKRPDLGVITSFLGLYFLLFSNLQAAGTPLIIPLESYAGSQRVLHARINGREGVFLFDSGGGVTNVTPEFATAIGCKPWGKIIGFTMAGRRFDMARSDNFTLELGGSAERLASAGVFDLMSLVPPGAPKLDGMVGLDAFANKILTIELANNRVIIETPDSFAERIKGATEEPVRVVRDAEGVALTLDAAVKTINGTAWMELDTGNDGAIVVADWLAAEFGLTPGQKDSQPIKFQLANGIRGEGPGRAHDLIMDGNLGSQFLKNWILTLDLPHGRAWFAPAQP